MSAIRLQRYIALLSIVLFIGKIWAWYITHSVSILTDALESIVNVIAGLIGLYSIILASKPRDINHPYGHGKAEFVSSAIEGVLIVIAGIAIVYESIMQLLHPKEIHELSEGIIITAVAGGINYIAGYYAIIQGRKNKSIIVESAGKHLTTDAYSTLAIVIGLLMLKFSGWLWLDSVVALIFAGIILRTGYKVVRKSLSGIMDEADVKLLKEVICLLDEKREPGWVDLHNLRVLQQGDRMHIDAHLTIPWYENVEYAEVQIHKVEDLIREHYNNRIEIFIHVDACQEYQCQLCAMKNCTQRKHDFVKQLAWDVDNVLDDSKHGKPLA